MPSSAFLKRPAMIFAGAAALLGLVLVGTAVAMADDAGPSTRTPAVTTTPFPTVTKWLRSEPPPPKKPVSKFAVAR